jgi:citryl-CoA lyase
VERRRAAAVTEAYWQSSVSKVTPTKVYVRGYDLEDLVGGLPFTAATYLLVKGRLPSPAETRVLDAVLTAVLDYSLHKPGTAAARYVVSGNPSMAAGLATAALAVGEHTLATEDTARFIVATHERFVASGQDMAAFATETVAELRRQRRRIPGLGHPVFKKVDPRGAVLRQVAVEAELWSEACEVYEAVHAAFTALPGKSEIPINDVGVMAAVMVGLGFTPEESTGLAIISTLPGVVAHVSEELRSGRPIRIVPDEIAAYDVAEDRDFHADWKAAGWPADG